MSLPCQASSLNILLSKPAIIRKDINHINDDPIEKVKEIISSVERSKGDILTYDFAFSLFSKKHKINIGKNISKAVAKYEDILKQYLETKPSILNYDSDFRDYVLLDSKLYENKNFELEESSIDISKLEIDKNRQKIQYGFEDWNLHLKSYNFGKISFWVNKSFLIKDIKVNLSCFLILNIDLSRYRCERILSVLEKEILDKGLKEILSQLNKYIKTTEELTSFKDYASAHKHTIKNYEFRYSLEALLKYLPPENKEAEELLESIKNTIIIRDLATQLFYSFDNRNSQDSFKNFNIRTLAELILTIHKSSYVDYKGLEHFKMDLESITKHTCNPIKAIDFLDIFNIINNLYSNTQKHCDDKEFFVTVNSKQKDVISIEFKTMSQLAKTYVDYLNDDDQLELDYHKGFFQIKESERKLNYVNIKAKSNKKTTTIKLYIYENTNN